MQEVLNELETRNQIHLTSKLTYYMSVMQAVTWKTKGAKKVVILSCSERNVEICIDGTVRKHSPLVGFCGEDCEDFGSHMLHYSCLFICCPGRILSELFDLVFSRLDCKIFNFAN